MDRKPENEGERLQKETWEAGSKEEEPGNEVRVHSLSFLTTFVTCSLLKGPAKCMYLHFREPLQHLNQSVLKNNKQNIVMIRQ